MSTPTTPGIFSAPAGSNYPNLSGLNLPKPLVDSIMQAYTLLYSLRDSLGQNGQSLARTVQYGLHADRVQVNPQAVPDGALFIETDDGVWQARLDPKQTTRNWFEVTGLGDLKGVCIRTLNLFDLSTGPSIAPYVPVYNAGVGIRAIGVLRKTITADLVITITRNAETAPLFTFTLPHSTPIHTDVVMDITSITFNDLDVLIAGITASDGSQDNDGIATLTIEWASAAAGGGGAPGGTFIASGDLAGTPTNQAVVGLENIPLDATTVSAPTDGQVIAYDLASHSYKAVAPPSSFTAGGDLSGTGTSQKVIGLESIPLDATTVGAPTNGQVIEFDSASGKYKAVTPASGFTAGGDLSGTGTSQKVIGLESIPLDATTVGAPTNGQVITYDSASGKYKAENPTGGTGSAPVVIGFGITNASIGTNVGPMLAAPRAGTLVKCVACVKGSDGLTSLGFNIKRNGTSVFSTTPTIAAGASGGSVFTFTTLTGGSITVAAGDVFSIDITSGTTNWVFTTQLE